MKRLVWFRNDLRLHDNEMLSAALDDPLAEMKFVYIHDDALDELTPEGYPRTGKFRKRMIDESLAELGANLKARGFELQCRSGHPSTVIVELCRTFGTTDLYFSRYTSFDERQLEDGIKDQTQAHGLRIHSFQTHTLFCDVDFKEFDLYRPMSFSKFRMQIEKGWPVRAPLRSAFANTAPASASSRESNDPKGVYLRGGEWAALDRLQDFIWRGDHLRSYKETRNGLIALNDSSKFSAYLAAGCLSPRFVYSEVRRYEAERGANASTLWFLYELLWRDHFIFAARHRNQALFTDSAQDAEPVSKQVGLKEFEKWRNGQTGQRFIDAAMIELSTTGWLSNRMRQNAASYLVHVQKANWKMGARWFESCLIDYDPCSNWGNWSYIAGAGPLNKPHIFDVEQQANAYDPLREYESYWLA